MIASVRGAVEQVGLDRVVVSVGGVGMLVHTTPAAAAACRLGEEAVLATTLVVREDSLTLFGFGSVEERDMFDTLQTVTGVGPRLALALLAVLSPDELRRAVSQSDHVALTRVPGVGKKVAERLALELRDKIGMPSAAAPAASPGGGAPVLVWREQVTEALTGLGWPVRSAADAVEKVAPPDGSEVDVATVLRDALRLLGSR